MNEYYGIMYERHVYRVCAHDRKAALRLLEGGKGESCEWTPDWSRKTKVIALQDYPSRAANKPVRPPCRTCPRGPDAGKQCPLACVVFGLQRRARNPTADAAERSAASKSQPSQPKGIPS